MDQTSPIDWNDYCCRPARRDFDFDFKNPGRLQNADVLTLLKYNQSGILFCLLILLVLQGPWYIFSVVPGFAKFDGAAGETSAVSHTGWWLYIEAIAIFIGAMSIYFGLHYTKRGTIEKGVGRTRDFLKFYVFVLVIAIIANIIHFVLCGIEYSNCTSTLCTQHSGFLVALMILIGFITFVEMWQIYRVFTYSHNIFLTLANGLGSWTIKQADIATTGAPVTSSSSSSSLLTTKPITAVVESIPNYNNYDNSVNNTLGNIRAPLLRQVMVDHASKKSNNMGIHALKTRSE